MYVGRCFWCFAVMCCVCCFFFFKQKTAYEMRISDWSSDVCSSDLATNLGLSRMAEVCGAGSRRALLRMQTWHMREETFRAALACLTDAIHAEPIAAWFGQGHRASADGQAFYLGGPGE